MWISFGSVHEVRAFRERKRRSLWFRKRVESCVVYGDRGYRGCEGVIVCGSREMRAKRQVVEVVKDVTSESLLKLAINKVKRGSIIYTDRYRSYDGLEKYLFSK